MVLAETVDKLAGLVAVSTGWRLPADGVPAAGHDGWVPRELPAGCRELLAIQGGVISRGQAVRSGVSENAIDGRLRTGAWQHLHAGVYATYTGEPPRMARLWAAVLRAGPGAALSHQTAAGLFRLADMPGTVIEVTVPADRRVRGVAGVRIHRSSRILVACHPSLLPPRTRVEETVVAFRWLCSACGSRLTTAGRLRLAIADRKKVRRRDELLRALAAIGDGAQSNLEYRYVRAVERAHQLPAARRQAKLRIGRGHRYLDNLYQDFGVAVELDGRAAHPIQDRWRDLHRDNSIAGQGITTLRYNWADVTERACGVAAEIAVVLQQRGWTGRPRQCGPGCQIRLAQP
jgi:very-short-patch-repair endonuclease